MDLMVFRVPAHFRVLTIVGVGFVAVGGGFIAATAASVGGIVVAVVFVGLAAALGYRQYGLRVTVRRDELVVRNFWVTRRIPRDRVCGFGRGRPTMGSGETILVDTGMSSVPLDALTVFPPLPSLKRPLERAEASLAQWAQRSQSVSDR